MQKQYALKEMAPKANWQNKLGNLCENRAHKLRKPQKGAAERDKNKGEKVGP